MSVTLHPHDFQSVKKLSDTEKISAFEDDFLSFFDETGLHAGSLSQKIEAWLKETMMPAMTKAGEKGKEVAKALANVHNGHDLAMIAVILDFVNDLSHGIGHFSAKAAIAFCLLLSSAYVRLSKNKS